MNFTPHATSGEMPSARYILPQFEERTPYGFKRQDPYAKLFEDRIIFLGTQVDDASADDVMAQLLVLESMDPERDITLYINSPGGSFTAMTAIYDTMQFIRPEVQTVCLGQAASAAAVLLGRGHPGQAPGASQRTRADPPARHGRRRTRHRLGPADPGRRGHAHARLAGEHPGRAQQQDPGRGRQRHRTRPVHDRCRGEDIRPDRRGPVPRARSRRKAVSPARDRGMHGGRVARTVRNVRTTGRPFAHSDGALS